MDMKAEIESFLSKVIINVADTQVTVASILLFALVVILTFLLTRMSKHMFKRFMNRSDKQQHASIYVLQRFVHYIIIALGLLFALMTLGVDMEHLALLATALSVGIGFGLQSIFNNFFSGIIILIERSLKVGDFIELEDNLYGTVIEINIRSTLVRTQNNLDVLVPNSEFVSGRVSNWTLNDPTRRLLVPFGVAYGTDKELVKKAALEAASRVDFIIGTGDRAPDVWLSNLGDNSLDFNLVVWINPMKNKKPGGAKAAILWEIETSLNEYNIEIPFPQRDVHIKQPEQIILQKPENNTSNDD